MILWLSILLFGIKIVSSTRPNIIFIMADDLGWNDVSWHDPNMHSPNMHYLAHNNAALLNHAYVNKVCSTTRSAFLAGHYAFHIGTQGGGVFHWMEPRGVPLEFKFFPERLQEAGYKTYMIGKWHLGYCKKDFLPISRGFDVFKGLYNGAEGYYNHSATYDVKYTGFDFWDTKGEPRYDYDGQYSTEIYADFVDEFLTSHDRNQSFFIYLAFQAVHQPLQVPKSYLWPCHQKNKDRKTYCGMVHAMDEAIGRVVDILKRLEYYDNTILIFSTDNGGQILFAGNNYPLRGNKATAWEGGTRAISFVHSPTYIKNPGVRQQVMSVVDWFPTILSAAGLEKYENYGDGINQWQMISEGCRDGTDYGLSVAVRRDNFKLLLGSPGEYNGWYPPVGHVPFDEPNYHGLLLFDLDADPNEKYNLIGNTEYGRIVAAMLKDMAELMPQMRPSVHVWSPDLAGAPDRHNGTFDTGWCK